MKKFRVPNNKKETATKKKKNFINRKTKDINKRKIKREKERDDTGNIFINHYNATKTQGV